MESNNVIQFPSKGNFLKTALSAEELTNNLNMVKHNHIIETLETIVPMLLNNMDLAGFDIIPSEEDEEDPNMKDCALVVEAIRSLMCKHYMIDHPFQDLSENLFQFKQDGSLTIAKSLDMDFESDESEEES